MGFAPLNPSYECVRLMSLQTKQLHPLFVAEVSGVDLARPLPADTIARIQNAIDRYAVLVFRDQRLDDDTQLAFARSFGPIEPPQTYSGKRRLRPEFADVSNLDAENRPRAQNDRRRMNSLGNMLWHTDASFRHVPGALSMLYAHAVPAPGPKGDGDTEFADLRAAWDALSPGDAADGRAARRRAFDLSFARPARLHRFHRRGARGDAAGAAAAGAGASRLRPQDAVSRLARRAHPRLAGA
jgi:alpha-ketoglutarate-dependent taurine dioxygenase